jgi:hypothetical protein
LQEPSEDEIRSYQDSQELKGRKVKKEGDIFTGLKGNHPFSDDTEKKYK